MEKAASEVKVSSIFIYPVKSCRGISVSEAPITPTGFRWDRHWLVINEKGRAYTQRVVPKLACVEVQLPNEAFLEGWEPTNSSYLVLKAPGMDILKTREPMHQMVFRLSGKSSRLVRFNAASETRPVKPSFGPKIMFSDLFSVLDSVSDPTFLLRVVSPFRRLMDRYQDNKFTFEGVMLCWRCKIPRINQRLAFQGLSQVKLSRNYRSDAIIYPTRKPAGKGEKGNVMKVGDVVYVLKMVSSADEAEA
ncbi:hypothetical protein M0R45_014046 [Rubus argutus]|uniref:Molybdenum cofactor sulfurase middle domain-containing protein n=1 Tax=Rubus argutus TaxID=59490 RepID=A0AAW1XMT4_RUBAR